MHSEYSPSIGLRLIKSYKVENPSVRNNIRQSTNISWFYLQSISPYHWALGRPHLGLLLSRTIFAATEPFLVIEIRPFLHFGNWKYPAQILGIRMGRLCRSFSDFLSFSTRRWGLFWGDRQWLRLYNTIYLELLVIQLKITQWALPTSSQKDGSLARFQFPSIFYRWMRTGPRQFYGPNISACKAIWTRQ